MIVVQKCSVNPANQEALIEAFADEKSEVFEGAEFVGLPNGCTIAQGSSVMTAKAEIAFRKSDNTWNWV